MKLESKAKDIAHAEEVLSLKAKELQMAEQHRADIQKRDEQKAKETSGKSDKALTQVASGLVAIQKSLEKLTEISQQSLDVQIKTKQVGISNVQFDEKGLVTGATVTPTIN